MTSPRKARSEYPDPRELAAYPVAEAARYMRLPPATLRSWVVGRAYPTREKEGFFEPLIRLPGEPGGLLSFWNLIEAHVLRAVRVDHGVPIKAVRDAVRYAEEACAIPRLLLSPELRAGAGELFLERYGDLINLSRSGQLAMRMILEAHLRRIEWDEASMPRRLFPIVRTELGSERAIAIDPFVAFGRPIVSRAAISTAVIAERIDAGETVSELAEDYGLKVEEIEEAVVYEKAA